MDTTSSRLGTSPLAEPSYETSVLAETYTHALSALKRGRKWRGTDSVSFVSFAGDPNLSKLYKKRYVEGSPWYVLPKDMNLIRYRLRSGGNCVDNLSVICELRCCRRKQLQTNYILREDLIYIKDQEEYDALNIL